MSIGAGESFLIDAGLNLQYHLANRIDLETGFSFTHFSNGSLKKPNFGINTLAPKISFKYSMGSRFEIRKAGWSVIPISSFVIFSRSENNIAHDGLIID